MREEPGPNLGLVGPQAIEIVGPQPTHTITTPYNQGAPQLTLWGPLSPWAPQALLLLLLCKSATGRSSRPTCTYKSNLYVHVAFEGDTKAILIRDEYARAAPQI